MSTHELEVCGVCQATYAVEKLTEFDELLVCRDCLEENTVFCSRCGERIWTEADAGDEHINLCQSCYDRYYTSCEHCNRVIPESEAYYEDDDDETMCYDCYCSHRDHHVINDYYFKPEPIFYGDGSRYFGVELEIDEGGESDSCAKQLLSIANPVENRMYCKHDGSLDNGFELVSHPMTLEYHQKRMPWAEILSKAKDLGYRSHQSNTCGLHVHINRSNFGETEQEQDECIARVLYFVEKHWEELLKFSRRSRRQMEQWAARYGYKEQPMELLDHAKKGYGGCRYTCVNLTNTNTIEFRMFRGTLKLNTFIATLQLVDRICDVALYFSDAEIKDMSWTTFVSGCTQKELVTYLKERRLYVNDPVESEEEI